MKLSNTSGAPWFDRRDIVKLAAGVLAFGPLTGRAEGVEVALAGMAFAGDRVTFEKRFPYSMGYDVDLKSTGSSSYKMLKAATNQSPPQQLKLVDQIDELKGRDQAIAVALLIGAETVSTEKIAGLHKLFILIRAQALFFDFKSMSVVRAYPISFAYIDVFDRAPSEAEIKTRVRYVYEGVSGKPGIFTRFGSTLSKATLPTSTSRYLQISKISIKPEAMANIPDYLTSNATVAETWAADLVGEALSTRAGVPIIPYSKGYAVGNVMSMRVSDGDVFNLKLPQPDYEISVEMSALRKIKFNEVPAGVSYIYGTYASMKIEEPLSGKVYLNTALKNGEVKVVPITQTSVDDFPAFYDSVNGLFVKLSEAIDGKGNTWVKTAAAAPDIEKQIADTRELVKLCK